MPVLLKCIWNEFVLILVLVEHLLYEIFSIVIFFDLVPEVLLLHHAIKLLSLLEFQLSLLLLIDLFLGDHALQIVHVVHFLHALLLVLRLVGLLHVLQLVLLF